MASAGELAPPAEVRTDDPGARQLAEHSDSEDQFTDAESAPVSPPNDPSIPTTRVEKVDNEPAHGEVPGTEAHELRKEDAKPDEIAVNPHDDSEENDLGPGDDVPSTVLEEASGPDPAANASEEHKEKREADAVPDVVVDPEGNIKDNEAEDSDQDIPAASTLAAPESAHQGRPRRKSSQASRAPTIIRDDGAEEDDDEGEGFGDDFDDFEEGDEEEDFDDFEDGFEQPAQPAQEPMGVQQPGLPFPIPDLDGLTYDDILAVTEPQLATLFPPEELDLPEFPPLPKDSSAFTTPRSASLWSQLVAPPPLAPPDWIRSRTRRLFLVSLGVPVDLDEILPASKQKKLVLPSLNIPSSTSPRTSSESRSMSRLRQGEGNASSTSLDTQGKSKRRKGPPSQPEFDMVAARHTCTITDEALDGMTNAELKAHVDRLKALEVTAKEALEFWKKKTDEKIAERETFEGVIENLVKHARKVRK